MGWKGGKIYWNWVFLEDEMGCSQPFTMQGFDSFNIMCGL